MNDTKGGSGRRLVGFEEAAANTVAKVTTVRDWLRHERIPHIRLTPHFVRFDLDELDGG